MRGEGKGVLGTADRCMGVLMSLIHVENGIKFSEFDTVTSDTGTDTIQVRLLMLHVKVLVYQVKEQEQ